MALNNSVLMAKHPRFDGAAYQPLSIFANSLVEIINKTEDDYEFDPIEGVKEVVIDPLWRGFAAVTPAIDWRARTRVLGMDDTAVHGYRVQLWHIDKNMLVPRDQWGDKSLRVTLRQGLTIRVVEHNSDPMNVGLRLVVRNAITDSDWWQPTMFCDVDTGDHKGVGH